MACDLHTQAVPWTSKLILVDETGQATEPMSIMPFQVADADAHVVLMGDHMQLAPTVLSKAAEYEGLGGQSFRTFDANGRHRPVHVDPSIQDAWDNLLLAKSGILSGEAGL